ncbi:MAG TPA: TRAP transporter substrate-binding protein [Geminicoccaceae bacterium]
MQRRTFTRTAAGALASGVMLAVASGVLAQEVTLKVAHFLPAAAPAHALFMEPWARQVEADSGGRIKVEIYPAMQLGGRAPQLYDQLRDGIADVVWTLPGYTPGRFPTIEVFELPFLPASAEATSQAVQAFYEKHRLEEFADIHPLMFHVHAPGLFHMKGAPIRTLEDLQGKKIRAPTRVINESLGTLGATPVGMPVPQVPEALSRGVVDGVVIPWEVSRPLRVHELTDSHTSFAGDRGFYTSVFLFGMNKQIYESLPDDLKTVIDNNSGMALAQKIGKVWDEAEEPGRQAAEEVGAEFYVIEGDELERWKEASQPVIAAWIEQMSANGQDGAALVEEARSLIQQYSQ